MFEQSKQGAVDVIRGDEPINVDHIPFLVDVFERCWESGQPRVVLDMQLVPLIDSAGLEMLLDTQDKFRKRGGVLKLASMNPLCERILNVTGVDEQFEIFPDTTRAVGSFVR